MASTPRITRSYTPEQQTKLPKQYFEDRASGEESMPGDPAQIKALSIAQFLYSFVTLAGAVLMFQLRRVGFRIYIVGVAIGLLLPVLLAGFGALNTSFGAFFSIIFAGLYWLNLNEMH